MSKKILDEAIYKESPVSEYRGNPLIEALPAILSEQQAAESIAFFPMSPDQERHLASEVRLHCIDRIKTLVQPLSIHLELESAVSTVVRTGYCGRNPTSAGTWRHLHNLSTEHRQSSGFNSTASMFSLVGLSGIGKSTALESILRLYPQRIVHRRYQNREFVHTQIVWLKLDCPFDGSLSGLCRAFFRSVDAVLGQERYSKRFKSRVGIPELIQAMEQVASIYFVGALFIDELQHLRAAKSGGKENMLNFFVNLLNDIGIPVIFVGNNSMVELFGDVLRNARRACGLGLHDFKQPKSDDPEWELLVDAIWEYQWVRTVEPLTPEIRAVLYDLTQGVTDFLAKLMILGQRYAIQSGKERLTTDVFKHVADTKMQLLKPALSFLRSGCKKGMKQFEDLLPTDVQIADMMAISEMSVDHQSRMAILKGLRNAPVDTSPSAPSEVAVDPATEASVSILPTFAEEIAGAADTIAALKEAGWISADIFEFSGVYSEAKYGSAASQPSGSN